MSRDRRPSPPDAASESPPQGRVLKKIPAVFYRSEAGNEPVRDWLKTLERADRLRIGEDIATVEFGWPVGMPTGRAMKDGLHEVRTNLPRNRTARVLFYVDGHGRMVLLHGFIKKTQGTPDEDLGTARDRKSRHAKGMKP